MKKKIIIGSTFLVFVVLGFILAIALMPSKKEDNPNKDNNNEIEIAESVELKPFNIIKVENKNNEFRVETEKVDGVKYYKIILYDKENKKIFETLSEKEITTFSIANIKNKETYSLVVYAFNSVEKSVAALNPYEFTWEQANFTNDSPALLDNKDYVIKIDGDVTKDNYSIKIVDNNKTIIEEKLTTNKYTLKKKYYYGLEKELVVYLLRNDIEIDAMHLFNKGNPVSDVIITSPKNNELVPYSELIVSFDGGDYANKFVFNLYLDNKLIYTKTNTVNKYLGISKEILEMDKKYRLEVIASYKDFSKKASIYFTTDNKLQLNGVYISNDYNYLKKNSKIILASDNENAQIYYTLDGSEPTKKSKLYDGPITINKNTVIKAVAIYDGFADSIVNTYKVKVQDRKKLTIYLSPSNQSRNLGVDKAKYTNERDEMNDLSNYIVERLEANGVKVVRNKSTGNIKTWVKESKDCGADVHLAIHSNASVNHDKYGIETWIDAKNSKTFSLANAIQQNLLSIYPYRHLEGANRGVKFAYGSLGEVNENNTPVGILVEIAHHDNFEDAAWIMNNKKQIAYSIADAVLKYYQIID